MTRIFHAALEKGAAGERLSREEAHCLVKNITPDTLHELGSAALSNRKLRYEGRASFVFNIQINPANICVMNCTFCNYAAGPDERHAFVLSEDDILDKVKQLSPTEVHIVGGLNNIWPYRRNLELVRSIRKKFPEIFIKAFTAVEIDFFAKTTKKSTRDVLEELIAAGVESLTGGGAEIFSKRLYQQHWKKKIGPRQWLDIHRQAHESGISTNATMLFGFGDTWTERVEHLLILRKAQEITNGFACFIPLAFQPGPGRMLKEGPTPMRTLMVLALSRLILDNIPHIKSYWPMAGLETAAAGLSWGADDMDGTISEEKIAHMAGAKTPVGLARKTMIETISAAGFTPIQRDGRFRELSS